MTLWGCQVGISMRKSDRSAYCKHSSSQAPPENVVCADKCVRTRRTHYCLSWVLNTIVHMKWSSFYKDVILSLSSNGEIRSRQATYMLVVARQVAISRGIRYRTPNLVTEQKKLFGVCARGGSFHRVFWSSRGTTTCH